MSPKATIYINTIADQYSFDNGATWTTNPVKTNLSSGYHYLMVKNASGCVSQSAYAYVGSAPSIPPTPLVTVVQPSTCDATDGSITINNTGSSYTFTDGASWTTNPVKKNIGAGTYIIRIKTSSAQCESTSVTVTLNSGNTIAAPAVSVTQPTCNVATGTIAVTTAASTFSYDDGLTFTYANTKSGLAPGTYKVKIKNASGCLSEVTVVTVNAQAPLAAPAFSITQPTCADALGSIEITTPAAEYSFDNGITYTSSNKKLNVAPGTYNLMIKDTAGCFSVAGIATVNVQPATPAAPQISVINPAGCAALTGTISVTSAAAFYSYDDGVTWVTNASAKLSPGNYQVRIKLAATGCVSPATVATVDASPNAPQLPVYTVLQPLSCANPFGSIKITSTEFEYSFNNGVTYTSNSASGSLSPGIYLLKVRNSTGCESASVSVKIDIPADTPMQPTATVQQINCNNPSGKITINESASQYSIDNGFTWQNTNIFTGLSSKTYQIKIKNAAGCESVANTVVISQFTNPTAMPSVNAVQNFCVQQNATLSNIMVAGNQINWYDLAVGGNSISPNTPLMNGITYYVTQTLTSCESERKAVHVNIISTPAPTGLSTQTFCTSQNAKVSDLVVSGNNIKWYSAASGSNVLAASTLLQNGATYFATQTENSCESVPRLAVTVALVATTIPANDFSVEPLCSDENGTKKVDLTQYQNDIVANSASYIFSYYDQNNNLINNVKSVILQTGINNFIVELKSPTGCSAKVNLSITVNASPIVTLPATAEYCPNETVSLDAGSNTEIFSYGWMFNGSTVGNQQILKVGQSGTYTVTVTNKNGCSTSKLVVVKKVDFPVITEVKIENSNAQIIATGSTKLEYSVNGTHWQTSNFFYNLQAGNYTAYVRSGSQTCAVAERVFTIFKISNAFTPNGDGVNDKWHIEGIENYPGTKVKVIDRFGTVVLDRVVDGTFFWNGEYASKKLPTANYWYHIALPDGRILNGYVLIKNRN